MGRFWGWKGVSSEKSTSRIRIPEILKSPQSVENDQEPRKNPKAKKSHKQRQKCFWTIFWGGCRSLPIKTRVLRQSAPENSPENSAKSLSQKFFGVPFLSLKRGRSDHLLEIPENWGAANGGLRDGGLRKSEDIWGKRPFSSVFWIFQVLFRPSGKGRKRQKKGKKGRFRPISGKGGQTPLKPPFVTPPFAAAQVFPLENPLETAH